MLARLDEYKQVLSLVRQGSSLYHIKEDKTMKSAKYPCRNCVYFDACGESSRTHPCDGRKTKQEGKQEENENGKNLL